MKTLKVKSILFSLLAMMTVAAFMTSCEQEEALIPDSIEQVIKEDTEQAEIQERCPTIVLPPCYPTGGKLMPNIQSESHCNLYWGFEWSNGQCWACY